MAGSNPQDIAQDWANKLGASTDKITRGVNAVTVAPGVAAARQQQVWLANTTASANKWARNVQAVPLSAWQADMINKGVQRIGTGAQQARDKFAGFLTAFLPHVDAGVRALPARGNLDANIARAVAMMRHNAQFSMKVRGQ